MSKQRVDTSEIHKVSSYNTKLDNDVIETTKYKPRRKNLNYSKYLSGESYQNFLGRINNPVTKEVYIYNLFILCEKLNLTTEQLYQFSDNTPKKKNDSRIIELENKLKDIIIDFKKPLKENDPHATTIHMNIYAFEKFCIANRINLNFKWLKGWLPRKPVKGKDKKYSREQIISMLNKGAIDPRSKLIVTLFSTCGIREAALSQLRTRDISAFYDDNNVLEGASICVYRGEPEEDVIFTTPECFHVYEDYLEARRNLSEEITPDTPVIIGRVPAKINKKKWSETEPVTPSTISAICVNVAVRAGVRKRSEDYEHRYVSKVTYGFRKHFETTILNSKNKDSSNKLDPYRCDRLLNHGRNGGLPMIKHYDDSSIKDMFQYYKRVIPDLTFSEEQKYKVKFEHAEGELKAVEQARTYIKEKEWEIDQLKQQISKLNGFMKYSQRIDYTKLLGGILTPEQIQELKQYEIKHALKIKQDLELGIKNHKVPVSLEKEAEKIVKKARLRIR